MKKITVYCGSQLGKSSIYEEGVRSFALEMANRNMSLIYGAGRVGLMGILADIMLEEQKEVLGIIPQKLVDREVAHQGCTELLVVDSMRERKWLMAEKGDGFVALPGGIGTLEELFEVMTLNQLQYIQKPLAIYNLAGYFDPLLKFLHHASKEGFLYGNMEDSLIVSDDPAEIFDKMENLNTKGTPNL